MHLRDIKNTFLITLLILVCIYMILSILIIGFEEGTNTSSVAFFSDRVMSLIIFSIDFWAESIGLLGLLAVLMAFSTTSMIVSIPIVLLRIILP